MASSRRYLLVLGIMLLAVGALLVWRAPASPHGALARVALARSQPLGKASKIATVSDRSLPIATSYAALDLECVVSPPDGEPHTLLLELTGGARVQLGEQVTDLRPDAAIRRHVFELPASARGVALKLHYMPFNSPPFVRLMHWDRAAKQLEPVPRTWVYPTQQAVGESEAPRVRSHLAAIICLVLGLVLLRAGLPGTPAPAEPIGLRACAAALATLLLLYAGTIAGRCAVGETLLRGDARAFLDATRSLLEDRDLDLRGQAQLHLYESGGANAFLSESETVVALGQHGELYPKHPWILPVVAAPFYRAFGQLGFAVLNALLLLLLGFGMFVCARHAGGSPAVSACVAVLLGASPLAIAYSYSISIDVLGAALATAGLALAAVEWPLLAGLLLGGSLLVRVTHAWVLIAALCVVRDWRSLVRLALGVAAPVAILLFMNWRMFGDPLSMSYNRVLVLVGGERAIASHAGLFDRALGRGLLEQLLDWPRGLLYSAPLVILAWAGFPPLLRRASGLALGCLVAAAGLYATFAVYVYSADSPFGSRFLLPLVGLAAAPLAALLQAVLQRRNV